MENGEKIKTSARKIELSFSTKLEKSAAEEEVKKAIPAECKNLDNLKCEIASDEFYEEVSFTKVVAAFDSVAIRKDAQAVICANFVNGVCGSRSRRGITVTRSTFVCRRRRSRGGVIRGRTNTSGL